MSEVHTWILQQLSTKRHNGVRGSLLLKPEFITMSVRVSAKTGREVVSCL